LYMSFLAPLTLIGLALLALPVLIHLLVRRRAKRLDFPSLRFLRETPSFRLYPRRVRQPLLLALRIAALLMIILGLARPFISFNRHAVRTRVILIDASLSMSARGRAAAAIEQARAILSRSGEDESIAIVAFANEATVLVEATRERDRLTDALKSYEPVGGSANYRAGIEAAAALLRQAAPGTSEIDLISDFQQSGLVAQVFDGPIATAARIVPYAVGSELERNAFLTDQTPTTGATVDGVELSATEIVSATDGQRAERRTWTIDAVDGARPGIEWRTQINGQITGDAKANAPDEFDADDQYYFAFARPPRDDRALLIETDEGGASLYLRAALEAANVEGGERFTLDRRRDLPGGAAELTPYSLVVLALHGAPRASEVRALSEYARAGGTVWLCLARDIDVGAWNALAGMEEGLALPFTSLARTTAPEPFSFGVVDADAPALRSMGPGALAALRSTRVRAGFIVTPRAGALNLARWSDGTPAFVSLEAGTGRILLLATSPEREASDLGLSPSLPALAYSIRSAAVSAPEPPSRIIGEPVLLGASGPGAEVSITDAAGHTTRAKARELAQHPQRIFQEPGIYRLEFEGQQRFMAFNAPAAESMRALAAPEAIKNYLGGDYPGGKEKSVSPGVENDWREWQERRAGIWRLFLCAAFILLVVELFVAMRAPP